MVEAALSFAVFDWADRFLLDVFNILKFNWISLLAWLEHRFGLNDFENLSVSVFFHSD